MIVNLKKLLLTGLIFENSSYILLTKACYSFASFLVISFMAIKMGPNQVGMFSIAMGLWGIFQLLSVLGYDVIVVREISKDKKLGERIIQHGLVLGFFSSFVASWLMIITGHLLNYSPGIMKSVCLSCWILLPYYINLLGENIFIGLKKARFSFFAAFARETVWVGLSVLSITKGMGYDSVILAFLISRIVGMLLMSYFFQLEGIFWWKNFHWLGIQETIALIPTFFFINSLTNFLGEADVVILSKLVPVVDVGLYKVTKGVVRVSFMSIYSIITSYFPNIVEAMRKPRHQILSYFNTITFQILVFSLLITVTIGCLARTIIMKFFGIHFIVTINLIHILIWKIIPLGLVYLWSRFLLAANQQSKELLSLVISVPIFIFAGIMLVKNLGIVGMAYADISTLIVLALINLYFVNRTLFKYE